MEPERCPRCWEFEEELRDLRQRLAARGEYVTCSPGPNPIPDVQFELARWHAANPGADAAAGFRAGWARLARVVAPKLREWEARWWRAMRANDGLRAKIGVLLLENSRLRDRH